MKKRTKIIIIVVSIIILCVLLGTIGYFVYDYNRDIEFTSIDDSFKITLPNKIKPKQTVLVSEEDAKKDYMLDIISVKKQIFMYAVVVDKERDLDFKEFINNEKTAISSSRENVRNLSDVTSTTIAGLEAYTYNYLYFDTDYNSDLYTEVYWVIDENQIYIFDFEVISENMDYAKTIFVNAMNTLQILK